MRSFFYRGFRNASISYKFSNVRKIQLCSILAANLLFRQSINCADEYISAQKVEEAQKKLAEINLINTQMQKYEAGSSSQYKEQQIVSQTIKNNGQDYKIILVRYENKIYALSALCTYDLETDLSDGIVFGNKLYCPKHGCQYDITNGFVEQSPAIDYLPKFAVEERDKKVYVYAPSKVPKKVLPHMYFRDFNDIRKVVVIGGGQAGFAAVQTFRELTFTGQVVLVSNDIHPPYDKSKLTKKIKDTKPEDFYLRNDDWFNEQGIELCTGRNATVIHNKFQNNYVELEDGMRVEYDGLLIATGAKPIHKEIPGLNQAQNIHQIDSLEGHQNFKKALEKTQKLVVLGINWESLETISTIRKEYPNVEITAIDLNKTNYLQTYFGVELSNTIIDLHKKNNVKFFEQANLVSITEKNGNKREIQFKNGKKIQADTIVLFPNNTAANTDFIQDYFENIEFDIDGRIKTDIFQRSEVKRVFSAGRCSTTSYFVNGDRYPCIDFSAAFQQGITAAYNIMALDIPWHYIPFNHTEMYGKVIQRTGYWPKYDQTHVIGDLNSMDFIIFYGWNDYLIGALGTQSKKNYISIINEALRIQKAPLLSEISKGKVTMEQLARYIRKLNRSGCYKGLIMKEKDKPVEKSILWQHREDWAMYPNKTYDQQWSTEFRDKKDTPDAL